MPLTNRQIERYSRQLIVQGFGADAQRRLLAAHIMLIAPWAELDPVLGYLVGAGVGQIDLPANHQPTVDAAIDATVATIAQMRDLNPDSSVRVGPRIAPTSGAFDLAVILVGDSASFEQARELCDRPDNFAGTLADNSALVVSTLVSAFVFARLDQPARIAVIPRRPPCPRCIAADDLLAPLAAPADNAAFVASLAALEAIKILSGFAASAASSLIEFRGYQASARVIVPDSAAKCSCNAARRAQRSSQGPPKGHR